MAANLPSPVVGAGGQGSRPWYEQALIALAQQGPGMLMQFLDRRQDARAAQANDVAAQAALQAMVPSMNAEERAALGGIGAVTTPPQAAGMPASMKPVGRVDVNALPQGAAAGIVEQFRAGREHASAMATQKAQQGLIAANTDAAVGSERRAQQLFPLERERVRADTARASAQLEESRYNLSFAQATESYRKRTLAAQALQAEGDAKAAQAAATQADRDLRTWAQDRTAADMQRIVEATQAYASLMPPNTDGTSTLQLARELATRDITGVPRATRADIMRMYENAARGAMPVDLDQIVHGRVMGTLGLSPEDLDSLDVVLGEAGGDGSQALLLLRNRGASPVQLAKAAGYYKAALGSKTPIELPVEQESAIRNAFKGLLERAASASMSGMPSINTSDPNSVEAATTMLQGARGITNAAGTVINDAVNTAKDAATTMLEGARTTTDYVAAPPSPEEIQRMNTGFIRGATTSDLIRGKPERRTK